MMAEPCRPDCDMKTMKFRGKVIIVAGGTGGIGQATSRLLARSGAIVVAAGRDCERLNRLEQELRKISPGSLCRQLDVGSPASWQRLVAHVMEQFHRIDALVHCAGILIPGRFDNLTQGEIDCIVSTNVMGVINGTSAVLAVMKQQRGGHIVSVGSLGGIMPMPFESLYSATKFAVRGFSLSLSEELRGTGIQVSLVSPGPVATDMLTRDIRADAERFSADGDAVVPAGRAAGKNKTPLVTSATRSCPDPFAWRALIWQSDHWLRARG